MKEKEVLKTLLRTVAVEAQTHAITIIKLSDFLDATIKSLKKLIEKMSTLKDDLIETFDQYFEQAKEQITFFYMRCDFSQMDLFKVLCGGQIIDEDEVPPFKEITLIDSQVIEDAIRSREALEDQ